MPTLYLNGVETSWQKGSLSIDDAVDERSAASFTIPDTSETSDVTKGTPVQIVDSDENGDDVIAFSGVVETTSRKAIVTPDGGGIYVTVSCADNHWYLDKRLVAEGYQGQTSDVIAKDLVEQWGRFENIYDHPYPGHAVTLSRVDLLGYWRLAADATDDSYLDHDGTDVGAPTYSGLGTGSAVGDDNLGGHVTLDGTDDFIELPTDVQLPVNPTVIGDSWTIAGWTRKTATTTPAMWAEGVAANFNNDLLIIYVRESSNDIRVWIDGAARLTTGTGNMSDGVWHHVAVTYDDDSGTLTAYIDGTQVAQESYTITPWTSNYARIGAVNDDGTDVQFYDGDLAEVQALTRVLTADEVALLHEQGGKSSRIGAGPTLTNFVLNYQSVSEGFEELAELSGMDFFVDPYRTVHLHERGADCCNAPFTVTDTNVLSGTADLSTEAPKYRNRQIVKGGKDKTAQQVEVQDGDGEKRSYVMGFEIAEEPTIEIDRDDGNGFVSQTVGIRGVDEGVQWYWSKGDYEITHDDDETALPATGRVRCTYVGQFSFVAISIDEGEQILVREIEKSGTGVVETVIEDSSIDSREQGFDIASSKLERYATRGQTFKFTTRNPGLHPGQVVTIDFSRLGISSVDALIETVETDDFNGIELRYSVSAVTGPVLQSWLQFFAKPAKKLVVPTERANLGSEEIVTLQESFTATITRSEGADPVTERTCVTLGDGTPTLPFTLC